MKKNTMTTMLRITAGAVCVATALTLAACSKPNAPAAGGDAPKAGEAPAAGGSITIKGSDTMVHLVSAWAEAYMDANPGTEISVTGGGSGTGIAALLNKTTDICMSSRDLSPEEAQKAKDAGLNVQENSPALDGIAIVVNPGNPVTELTLEQLGKIFTGEFTNWNQVGGPDQPINAASRESSSGTYVYFQEHVLKKKDFGPNVMLLPATAAIVQSVAADAWNIGYVGLGYEESAKDKIKTVAVKQAADSPAVSPSIATVKDGSYPIARKLHLYVTDTAPAATKEFLAFCASEAGQKIVAESGYVPVN